MQPHLRLIIVFLLGSISICRNVCGFPTADDSDEVIDLSGYKLKYGLPDMASGQMVNDWQSSDPWNPEELGNYFEGDILMPKKTSSGRNGIVGDSYRWPNGIIPFEIKGNFDSQSLSIIQKAMDTYHQKTCIKFQRRTPKDSDYISIQNSQSGCFSSIGRVGGAQTVNLQTPACTTKVGTVLHELMHSAGFMHEQNREERDDYIDVLYQNIKSGYESNFEKARKGTTSGYGVGYDYGSVMHYSSHAFSVNGNPTINTKTKANIGQREGFSDKDVQKLNNMYKCKRKNAKENETNSNIIMSLIGMGQNNA